MSANYEIVVYWSDQDQAFIAEVPELLGCAADGPTYEEAVQAAQEAIQTWIEVSREEGNPIPQPQGRVEFA